MSMAFRALHIFLIVFLAQEVVYAGWQLFVVLAPDGHIGPLWGAARDLDPQLFLARRLYALEAWLAGGFLAVYLGITEIAPRRAAALHTPPSPPPTEAS